MKKMLILLICSVFFLCPMVSCSGNPSESGKSYTVESQSCIGCNTCVERCPYTAIMIIDNKAVIDPAKCIGCGKCVSVCPEDAIY